MSGLHDTKCRTMVHVNPDQGRVLLLTLVSPELHEITTHCCDVLNQEVDQHSPDCLVIDLLGYDSIVGPHIMNLLANGALALRKLEGRRKARVLATGNTAGKLRRVLSLTRLDLIYSGEVYPDLESALAQKKWWRR